MELFLSQFHLIRPLWLLALIPAVILFAFLLKRRLASARWTGIIDPSLMPHVLDQMPTEQSRWPLWFILLAWIITSIALAGPTWQQLPQPVQKKEDALVIVLDMSLSMAAQDVRPDRATRARQKIIDILKQRNEGLTALVVYAGDAYTVTPLTDDTETAINLVPALSPFIMPSMGSRPDKALILARKLITDAGLIKANYLLVTDGIQNKDIARIKEALGNQTQQLSILTLGTEEGAPIAMQGKGFKRDKLGNIVLPKLDLDTIKLLANELNVRWHQMTFDDQDWHYLLPADNMLDDSQNGSQDGSNFNSNHKPLERHFDLWADQGYWLIFIIIIIAAFSFRRGWMLSVALMISLQPEHSYAALWDDAWQTKDQQGQKAFIQDPAKAAELFENSDWKASSFYRAGEYEKAAESFSVDPENSPEQQAVSYFNRGNALAQAGELEQAIKAYDKALDMNIKMDDAHFNKSLVEKLLEQQEEQDQQDQDQDEKSKDEKSDDSESKDNNSKDNNSEKSESDQESDSDQKKEGGENEQDSDKQDPEENDSEEKDSEQEKSDENPDEKDAEQAEADKEPADGKEQEGQASAANSGDELSEEEKQALEQWLNRIPDDPGGLLKRKFLYQYKQRDHQDEGEVSW